MKLEVAEKLLFAPRPEAKLCSRHRRFESVSAAATAAHGLLAVANHLGGVRETQTRRNRAKKEKLTNARLQTLEEQDKAEAENRQRLEVVLAGMVQTAPNTEELKKLDAVVQGVVTQK